MFQNAYHAAQLPYYPELPQAAYGAVPAVSASPDKAVAARAFIPGQRRRINVVPIVIAVLTPWALFCVILWATTFSLHYTDPGLTNTIQALGIVAVAASAITAAGSLKLKAKNDPRREPNWHVFLFVSTFVAWLLAVSIGGASFSIYMRPYYDIMNLNSYFSVDPSVLRGQMVMDAGRIVFSQNSRLDLAKSLGFKNQDTYCVAPITIGNSSDPNSLQELRSYDFWAVGINCCSSKGGDFHCGQYSNPSAHGGLRLMENGQRGYFRLAVQQAEAAYKIKAVHPLFFEWMQDPIAKVNEYEENGVKGFLLSICSYLLVQTFVVACAVLAFSKMGQAA